MVRKDKISKTNKSEKPNRPQMRKVHLLMEQELYDKLWDIVKKRFKVPVKKFHIVVNEALREYIERHYEEVIGERAL